MDQQQTEALLIRASATDNRIVTDPLITQWLDLLGNFEYTDLVNALREHRLTAPGVYLEAGHLAQILTNRRKSAAMLQQTGPPMCHIHAEYPVLPRTGCDQCKKYPGDLAPGAPRPQLITLSAALAVGRHIPQEA